jgi:hypothetical protein
VRIASPGGEPRHHFEGIEPVTLACLSAAGMPLNLLTQLSQQKPIVLPSNDVVGLSAVIALPETGHVAFMALLLVVLVLLQLVLKKESIVKQNLFSL